MQRPISVSPPFTAGKGRSGARQERGGRGKQISPLSPARHMHQSHTLLPHVIFVTLGTSPEPGTRCAESGGRAGDKTGDKSVYG